TRTPPRTGKTGTGLRPATNHKKPSTLPAPITKHHHTACTNHKTPITKHHQHCLHQSQNTITLPAPLTKHHHTTSTNHKTPSHCLHQSQNSITLPATNHKTTTPTMHFY